MIDAEVEEQINDAIKLAKKIVIDMCKDKDFADAMATFYQNVYESLKEKGFNHDETMQLLANIKFPEFKK